ncbi:hypothetical protein [Aurantiacibacter poecillastricola]|uniref:hypothetical protein n=1 Tax=Aurantiacibacter poecillastricola TaxID=3064385 RepID=UPI00273FF7B6|nr:hypothetical protein [Aurantiacibacter sp. 219JJ12-13]MDP5260185.1 hypothetical protein [Aurantiacibacter sp. 219JJ12-13]
MRPVALALIAAVTLAACSADPAEEDNLTALPADGGVTDPAPPPPAEALSPIDSLAGEWRVAGIDGEPFDEAYGLALSADDKEIWWEPRCANFAFAYRIEGLDFETGPATPSQPVEPGAPPPPVCTVNPPARLDDVATAISAARRIGRTPGNAIRFEGGGHSLTLYSQ